MLEFFKVFLRGLICTILLPVILLVWVLYGVYCFISFIIVFIKATILFFKGDSYKNDLKEDAEAKKMLQEKQQAAENAQNMMAAMYQTAMAQIQAQNMMQNGTISQVKPSSNSQEESFESDEEMESEDNFDEQEKEESNDGESY